MIERFQKKVKINKNGCHEWTACKDSDDYGFFAINGKKKVKAHRVAYELYTGPIPVNMCVCHKCDNPSCVNPEHLFLGTHKDNMQDMSRKNRANKPKGSASLRSKLVETQVIQIKQDKRSFAEIAREYGVTPENISAIVRNKTWRHVNAT